MTWAFVAYDFPKLCQSRRGTEMRFARLWGSGAGGRRS